LQSTGSAEAESSALQLALALAGHHAGGQAAERGQQCHRFQVGAVVDEPLDAAALVQPEKPKLVQGPGHPPEPEV
jgi:hypothetical protein